MSKCYDAAPITGCFIPNDGSGKVSVMIHTTYDANGEPHKTYATSLDSETLIDPATYLGGGVLIVGDCPCITPAEFKCLKKRNFRFFYDNGITPGSSSNDGGLRPNFIHFDGMFTVIGWETNLGTLGAGELIGPATGWTPQLTEWFNFGANNYPSENVEHSFSFTPAPTWRAWVLEGCDPTAQFGVWTIRRSDGVIYKVYPRGYTESYEYVWCADTIDCDGNPEQVFYDRNQNPDTDVITWTKLENPPKDIDCFVNCDRKLPSVILPGAESSCVTKEYRPCDANNENVELILFVTDCDDSPRHIIAHTLSDWDANLTSPDPSPEVAEYNLADSRLVDCETGVDFEIPEECQTDVVVPICVESQEWTYGIDNTGTAFTDTATYELTLSDGSTLSWRQLPTTGWSNQLIQWSQEIQTAADNAGLVWFVEPRFIDNTNPTNLDGTISGPGGTPSGLPGAPSEIVATNLFEGGMRWRYVNFQICPGQPVPVSAKRIDSETFQNNPYELTTAGPVLGPVQKFEICKTCSICDPNIINVNWFIHDSEAEGGIRPAEGGEIPNCYEPCGVLSTLPPPPSNDCVFEFDTGCDDNNSNISADYTNLVTRRVTYCAGKQVAVDFYVPDPDDNSSLIDYSINGQYVDCATGETVALPAPPCEDFVISQFWETNNKSIGARNRNFETDSPRLEEANIDVARQLVKNFDFVNNSPTVDQVLTSSIAVMNDANNSGDVVDFEITEGYLCVTEPFMIRWTTNSEGSFIFELGECLGKSKEVIAHSKSVGFDPTPSTVIPKGLHSYKLYNIDNNTINSNWTPQVSVDGGNTWNSKTRVFDDISVVNEPYIKCIQAKICKDSGAIINVLTNEAVSSENLFSFDPICNKSTGETLSQVELCDGSSGIKVEIACCNNMMPSRWGRTYNNDNNVLGSGGINTNSGYDEILNTLGCSPGTKRMVYFQGAVYIKGNTYPYATQGITIPATETQVKNHMISAMNQAIPGTGVTLVQVDDGFIETRGPDVDIAWTSQKGLLDDSGDICWDNQYFIYRDDLDGTVQGDTINSPVSNPYDPLALINIQSGSTGDI